MLIYMLLYEVTPFDILKVPASASSVLARCGASWDSEKKILARTLLVYVEISIPVSAILLGNYYFLNKFIGLYMP